MSCATKRRKYLHAVEITTDDKRRCNFCHLGVETYPEDVTKSGKFYLFKDIHVHFFCVLFDKKTLQTSTADSGLFGFTYSKVKEALRRSNKKECGYCGRKGALIKCAAAEGKKCGMRFHFPCGINNGALFRFEGDYIAFCSRHKPDVNLGRESGALPDVTCLAGCLEQIRGDEDYLIGPCCQKKLHLRCLQEMALKFGCAHFKCPNCNERREFHKTALKAGIYVPQKDADWESPAMESFYNFFAMAARDDQCRADKCVFRGTATNAENEELVCCSLCGGKSVHPACVRLTGNEEYVCDDHEKEDSGSSCAISIDGDDKDEAAVISDENDEVDEEEVLDSISSAKSVHPACCGLPGNEKYVCDDHEKEDSGSSHTISIDGEDKDKAAVISDESESTEMRGVIIEDDEDDIQVISEVTRTTFSNGGGIKIIPGSAVSLAGLTEGNPFFDRGTLIGISGDEQEVIEID